MCEHNFGIVLECMQELVCLRCEHNMCDYKHHYNIVACLCFLFCFLHITILSNFYEHAHIDIVNQHVILLKCYYYQLAPLLSLQKKLVLRRHK